MLYRIMDKENLNLHSYSVHLNLNGKLHKIAYCSDISEIEQTIASFVKDYPEEDKLIYVSEFKIYYDLIIKGVKK